MVLTQVTVPSGAEADSPIIHQQANTRAFLANSELGSGSLYIAENCLTWVHTEGAGLCLSYPEISLHAVSRDTSGFPHECLYVMLDKDLVQESGTNGAMDDSDEDEGQEDSPAMTELRFVPDDNNALQKMYEALAHAQSLHPDPDDVSDEDEDDDEDGEMEGEEVPYQLLEPEGQEAGQFYTDASGLEHLTPQGRSTLERLEGMLASQQQQQNATGNGQAPVAGQFDDAEMEES